MFSCTVSLAKGWVIWKVRTMPAARDLGAPAMPVMSCPSSSTRPLLTGWKPAMQANRVVLPAPLGPISATMRPSSTCSEALSTARRPPKILVSPVTLQHQSCLPRWGAAAPEQVDQAVGQVGDDDDQQAAVQHQRKALDLGQHAGDVTDQRRAAASRPAGRRPCRAADHAHQQHLDRLVDAEHDQSDRCTGNTARRSIPPRRRSRPRSASP